jgi:hypothetical protein
MKQLIICTCILMTTASCELSSSRHLSADRQKPSGVVSQGVENSTDSITVFLTGNMLGSLKPCGCSGGQLGGLDRRPAVFNTVPVDKRLLIDTGTLVENQSDQDFFKFIVIIESLKYLKYDVVNLTQQDIKMAKEHGPLDTNSVGFISSYPTDENFPVGNQHEYLLDGQKINISVVSFDPLEKPIEYLKNIFPTEPGEKSVNILIINNYSDEIISEISQLGIVDCLVCPIESDEPTVTSKPGAKPLVCAVGKFGRHISKLVIKNAPDDGFKLSFEDIPVKEELPQDEYLISWYTQYQEMVKDAGLLEKNLRFSLPDDLKYVGSETCSSIDCHFFEYTMWSENQHSHAYATLEGVGSQYDPECVVCHVVGYDFENGFKSAEKTPQLENVGCEYCHGPGSAHNKNPYENKMTIIQDKIKLCEKCHTPEHSGDFAGNEQEKLQIINHWPEPNDVSNVK